MALTDELYSSKIDTSACWNRFSFLDPAMAMIDPTSGNIPFSTHYFQNFLKRVFLDYEEELIHEEFVDAMNRGIETLNTLVSRHLPSTGNMFLAEPIPDGTLVVPFLEGLERDFGSFEDSLRNRELYEKLRAFGLGDQVLEIDIARNVYTSAKYYDSAVGRSFETLLDIGDPVKSDCKEFEAMRASSRIGVTFYGTWVKPFRTRLKYLTEKSEVRYESIIMKLIGDGIEPTEIKDHIGVELVVADEEQRERLLHSFRMDNKNRPLKDHVLYRRGIVRDGNPESSLDYSWDKFIWGCIVPASMGFTPLVKGKLGIPAEVQVITIDDYRRRESSLTAKHSAYKRRQFLNVFPVLFPEPIYKPILEVT